MAEAIRDDDRVAVVCACHTHVSGGGHVWFVMSSSHSVPLRPSIETHRLPIRASNGAVGRFCRAHLGHPGVDRPRSTARPAHKSRQLPN